jgi:hypothetical protein
LAKGDDAAASTVEFVTKEIWAGAKTGKKNDAVSIRIKGLEAGEQALANFSEAVERGYSIRHATFKNAVKYGFDDEGKVIKPAAPEYDASKAAKSFATKHTIEQTQAMIAALADSLKFCSDADEDAADANAES